MMDLNSANSFSDPSHSNERGIKEVGSEFRDRLEKTKMFKYMEKFYRNESRGVVQQYLSKIGVLKYNPDHEKMSALMTI